MVGSIVELIFVLGMMVGAQALQVSQKEAAPDAMTPLELWRWKQTHRDDDDFELRLAEIGVDEKGNEETSAQEDGDAKKKKLKKKKDGNKDKNSGKFNPWETVKSWGDAIMGGHSAGEESVKDAVTESTEEASSAAKEVSSAAKEVVADIEKAAVDRKAAAEDVKPRKWVHPEGNRTRPRMLVTPGCDGSSAIIQHAHSIMELYGINTNGMKVHTLHDNISHVLQNTDKRVLVEDKEHVDVDCNDKCRAILQAHKYYEAKNRSFIFKGTIGEDQPAILSKSISDLGTYVAEVTRKNKLDQLVCMVRDCFANQEFGHPLLDGKKSSLCWKRREANPEKYQAFLRPSVLLENMDHLDNKMQKTTTALEKMGYSVEQFWAEDLLDFELDQNAMGKSLKAWTNILKAWGIRPGNGQEGKLKAYLEENAGKRDRPANHVDTIYNFEDVKKVLKDKGRFSWMIRE